MATNTGKGNILSQAVITIAVLLGLWQLGVWLFEPPRFLFPSPLDVANVFKTQPLFITINALITVQEMLLGLLIGTLCGMIVALLLSTSTMLERYLMPLVITTQTLPVFAIAPILVIWFGLGLGSKIVMAALIIFFPITSSFYDGLKQTPKTWLDLSKSWGAGRFATYRYLKIPAALPSLMSGLKIAATLAPIGAIVGEWAGAAAGLGFVMLQANARTQMDVVFASLIVLAFCAWLLRAFIVKISNHITWCATHAQ